MNPISFVDATKDFGDNRAVSSVSFEVPEGAIVGLVGANGAGKSTLLRALLGFIRLTSGEALVNGKPISAVPQPSRAVGALHEAVGLSPGLTASQNLRCICRALGIERSKVPVLLERTGASGCAAQRLSRCSTGERQRVGLAAALVGDPNLLVLDEPLNGLDPDGIAWFRKFLLEFARQGGTVLLSSHVLAELQQVVDRVVVLHHTVLFDGLFADLPMAGDLEASYFALRDGARPPAEVGRQDIDGGKVDAEHNDLSLSGTSAPRSQQQGPVAGAAARPLVGALSGRRSGPKGLQ